MKIIVETTDYATFSEFHYFTSEDRARKFIERSVELGFDAWIVACKPNASWEQVGDSVGVLNPEWI